MIGRTVYHVFYRLFLAFGPIWILGFRILVREQEESLISLWMKMSEMLEFQSYIKIIGTSVWC